MAQFIVPDGAQVKVYWQVAGRECQTVLGALGANAATFSQALANALDGPIKAALTTSGCAGLMPANVAIDHIGVRNVSIANQVEYLSTGAAVGGSSVTEALPRSVAVCVSTKTSRAGKRYRGRHFIPGFDEDQNGSVSTPTQGSQDAALELITLWHAALSANGLQPAVIGPALPERPRKGGGTWPAEPAASTPITAVLVQNDRWTSQRRRNKV